MFDKLKFFMSAFGWFWQYRDTIRTITNAWTSYPGLDDEAALRAWVRPILSEMAVLATLTPTPVDNMVANVAIKLVDNNHTFAMIHALALLGRDTGWINGDRIPQAGLPRAAVDTILTEMPENPALILTALGILLSLLQFRKANK
ncbi:MAG: hypothetical protein FWD31_11550 [Planctomycetaceae bacterium]|nr:hypothetical protein [Planctomycetaceae bacterium]